MGLKNVRLQCYCFAVAEMLSPDLETIGPDRAALRWRHQRQLEADNTGR